MVVIFLDSYLHSHLGQNSLALSWLSAVSWGSCIPRDNLEKILFEEHDADLCKFGIYFKSSEISAVLSSSQSNSNHDFLSTWLSSSSWTCMGLSSTMQFMVSGLLVLWPCWSSFLDSLASSFSFFTEIRLFGTLICRVETSSSSKYRQLDSLAPYFTSKY